MAVLDGVRMVNWLAHRHADLALSPLTIIAGPNESGKSSVGDGIAFALTGELRRVEAKGDRKQLLTDGAAKGQVELTGPKGTLIRDIPTGKLVQPAPILPAGLPPGLVEVLLEPASFARMSGDQRRNLLFTVSGADLAPETVLRMLLDRGHRRAKGLAPGGTVESWHKDASRFVTEARGEWKGITGETYGAQKAEGWEPELPPPAETPADTADLQEQVTLLESAIAQCNQELGAIRAAAITSTAAPIDLTALRDRAKQLPAWQDAKAEAARISTEAARAVREAEAALAALAGGTNGPEQLHCPDCGAVLMLDTEGRGKHLVAYAAADPVAAAQARQRAEAVVSDAREKKREADEALTMAEARLERCQEAQRVLDRRAAAAENIAPAVEPTGTAEEVQARLADHQRALGLAREDLAAAARRVDQVTSAAEKKAKAASAHNRVKEWGAIAAALAPDGIPAEVLGKALKPLNTALTKAAAASGWAPVAIGGDMAITVGGRPYGLHSESGRWRADALVALALAELTGARLVVLDRFDVLDLPSRAPALRFLFQTAQAADWTIIAAGTFKAPPQVPPAIRVHWFGPDTTSMERAA